jgi:hypothetical protein
LTEGLHHEVELVSAVDRSSPSSVRSTVTVIAPDPGPALSVHPGNETRRRGTPVRVPLDETRVGQGVGPVLASFLRPGLNTCRSGYIAGTSLPLACLYE